VTQNWSGVGHSWFCNTISCKWPCWNESDHRGCEVVFSKTWAGGIWAKEIKATFTIQDFGRQSLRVGFMRTCTCTASSFSLTHPTQLIHIQPPLFRKNSYPSYSNCSSQGCSVDRQPTQSVCLTCVRATLGSAGIRVCLGCISASLPSELLRAGWTKWPKQTRHSFDVINWTHYHQEWFWLVGHPHEFRVSQKSQRCCKVNCLSLVFCLLPMYAICLSSWRKKELC